MEFGGGKLSHPPRSGSNFGTRSRLPSVRCCAEKQQYRLLGINFIFVAIFAGHWVQFKFCPETFEPQIQHFNVIDVDFQHGQWFLSVRAVVSRSVKIEIRPFQIIAGTMRCANRNG